MARGNPSSVLLAFVSRRCSNNIVTESNIADSRADLGARPATGNTQFMYRYSRFSSFASRVARTLGHPITFMIVLGAAVLWLVTGPLFHFSANWYSAYSNAATIVTTLLLFIIQHTQSREVASMQLKLNEIIRVSEGAHNALLDIEELTDRDYDQIKANYIALARQAREQLQSGKLKWATARVAMESLDSFLDPSLAAAAEEAEEQETPPVTPLTTSEETSEPKSGIPHEAFSPRLIPVLERMARIAAHSGHAPRALIAVQDRERGWVQQAVGFDAQVEEFGANRQTPLAQFLAAQVSQSQQPIVISDVAGGILPTEISDGAHIDAFLAVPLIAAHQQVIGCLAVLDAKARPWQDTEIAALQDLAALTVEQIAEQIIPALSTSELPGANGASSASLLPVQPVPVSTNAEESKSAMQELSPAESPTGKLPVSNTVLVVDDSETNRTLLRRRLEREGYRVVTAGNGQEALEQLRLETVGLALLDVMMPEMDGEEVLLRMQADEQLRKVPVIVVSALDEQESVQRCLQNGAKDYILKPFDPAQLRARVHAYLPPPAQNAAQS